MAWSRDGRTLYVTAQDVGTEKLFAVDAAPVPQRRLPKPAMSVTFRQKAARSSMRLDGLGGPEQLYRLDRGKPSVQLTHLDEDKLKGVDFGTWEQFSFQGWNNDTVHGYVIKPVGFGRARNIRSRS